MSLNARIGRIESLLERAEPPAVELAQALLDLYGEGLTRIMAAADDDLAARLADDDVVAHLLLLHDLHPIDVRTRVEDALRGTGAEVVSVDGDLVRVRLDDGGCCSADAARRAVRDAAPEVERVEIVQPLPKVGTGRWTT
ncbi:hypothetical protein ACFFV7_14535 [Nonomuraea spiralis]|uniref:NifU family protein n=1 Tax=Nonomuraea spiralis TaxID=46182 RepID=A0ABV5IE90_9ACTN|nr:NifU family protein [Nonomuraea spiralis]GGT20603.1 hypothetical protein GCM10010176_076440 [Nonomuraea spiralis]